MKLRTLLLALVTAVTASAQTPWLHIYNTDAKEFKSAPASEASITGFVGASGKYTRMIANIRGVEERMNTDYVSKIVVGPNVPFIYITTEESINDINDKTTEYAATIRVDGQGVVDDLPETAVTFRGRGNSTLNYPKKPYRLKFAEKTKLCGFRKAKSYVLLANYLDAALMRNFVACNVAEFVGMEYANHMKPVNVFLNGDYKGSYMLTEKVGFNNGSVDLSKEDEPNSILLELDVTYDEALQGVTANYQLPYLHKDPDAPADPLEAKAWWQTWADDFQALETAVYNKDYATIATMVDYEQLAKYLIIFNVCCNQELNHPKSIYCWKTKGGKWMFGPAWDFDWAFGFEPTYRQVDTAADDQEAKQKEHDECLAYFKAKYGEDGWGSEEYNGTWVSYYYGEVYTYSREEGMQVYPFGSVTYLPSYQAQLLGTGKNTGSNADNWQMGNGGEFFTDMVRGNEEFLKVYAEVWARFEAQLTDFWAAFDAYKEELEPSAAYNDIQWGGSDSFDDSVKALRTWVRNRIKFIKEPANNYGLYPITQND